MRDSSHNTHWFIRFDVRPRVFSSECFSAVTKLQLYIRVCVCVINPLLHTTSLLGLALRFHDNIWTHLMFLRKPSLTFNPRPPCFPWGPVSPFSPWMKEYKISRANLHFHLHWAASHCCFYSMTLNIMQQMRLCGSINMTFAVFLYVIWRELGSLLWC